MDSGCNMTQCRSILTVALVLTAALLMMGFVLGGAASAADGVPVTVEVHKGDDDISKESRVIILAGTTSLVLEPGDEKKAYLAPGQYEVMAVLDSEEPFIPGQAKVVVEEDSPFTVRLEIGSLSELGFFGMDLDAAEAMAQMFSTDDGVQEEEVSTPADVDDDVRDVYAEPQPDMDAFGSLFGGMDPAELDPEQIASVFDAEWEDMDEEDMDMEDIDAMIGMLQDLGIDVLMEQPPADLSDASYAELEQRLADSDPIAADQAAAELAQRGRAALPTLQSLAGHERDEVRQRVYDSLYRMQSRSVSVEAAATVNDLLLQGLDDNSLQVRRYAAAALAAGGAAPASAVELLGRNAQADDMELRAASLRALAAAGPAAQSQERKVIILAGDSNAVVRSAALSALAAMEAGSPEAVEAVLKGTAAEHVVIRVAAAAALGGVAGPKQRLVPAALNLLHDKSSDVRRGAAGSLAAMAPHETMVMADMLPAFYDEDSAVQRNVLKAAGKGSVQDLRTAVLPAASLLTDDSDPGVRHEAALLLAAAGSEAIPQGLQALGQALSDPYPDAADTAAAALSALGSSALGVAMEGLESSRLDARRRAASILGDLGDAAMPAVPRLLELVADDREDDTVRAEAYYAVERITGERPQL